MAAYNLIGTTTVGSGGSSTIVFSSIPQTYTDLKIVHTLRTTRAALVGNLRMYFNGENTNGSSRTLYGNNSTGSFSNSYIHFGYAVDANNTASVFASGEIYIPNYTGSTYKSTSYNSVSESNSTTSSYVVQSLGAGLWSSTSAITSVTFVTEDGGNFVEYSSASLYGIKNS